MDDIEKREARIREHCTNYTTQFKVHLHLLTHSGRTLTVTNRDHKAVVWTFHIYKNRSLFSHGGHIVYTIELSEKEDSVSRIGMAAVTFTSNEDSRGDRKTISATSIYSLWKSKTKRKRIALTEKYWKQLPASSLLATVSIYSRPFDLNFFQLLPGLPSPSYHRSEH